MSFCTAINCMDGRVQLPVADYLKQRFAVDYVDVITDPGPVRILAEQPDSPQAASIFDRLDVSIEAHNSKAIAVVAHDDCAGNPVDEVHQRRQLAAAVDLLKSKIPQLQVIGLWVDDRWQANEV